MGLRNKLKDIKHKPIPFECLGHQWHMKQLTMKEVKALQAVVEESQDDEEKLIMMLFTDILVDADGNVDPDIEAGMTFDEILEELPLGALRELLECVTGMLAGNSGN